MLLNIVAGRLTRRCSLSRAKQRERNSSHQNNLIEIKQYQQKKRQVHIIPRNLSQESYIELLKNPRKYITFAIGPAGTGKTLLAVQMAIKALQEKSVEKIVITRPAVSVDEEHGFLPGTLNEKMAPWTRPIFDVFEEYYSTQEIAKMMDDGILEISPLAYMRGRTFKTSYIIADEMQNATPSQMKMLLTRLGENSKMVVTGDLQQADRPSANGLLDFIAKFDKINQHKTVALVRFDVKDIERHDAVKEILKIYGDTE
jgi:phosphate starvation-inducible protein PhoH and related proteins